MLTGLSIQNVVLIEGLDLEFGAGLTALTGETGAGKSIILDALGMATGARSDRGLVRAGTDKAQCVASFDVPEGHRVWSVLEAAEMDVSPSDMLILRRMVKADGGSRAFINDAPVSVKLLQDIGHRLLEVHGQHDGRGLMDVSTHIHLLDVFGGYGDDVKACSALYTKLREARETLTLLEERQVKAGADRDYFEHAIAEIDRLDPKPNEEEALADERRFLQGAEGALAELASAEAALGENGAFEERLAMALAGIERVEAKFENLNVQAATALKQASNALEKAMLETQEARGAVSAAAASFDVEPGRLEESEKRLFALRGAARKYDVEVAHLLDARARFAAQLTDIENVDADVKVAQDRLTALQSEYDKMAARLTELRHKAAASLEIEVMGELPPLKMERAEFSVSITESADGLQGRDKVRFEVSTNPGSPMGALDKIASGGEMARFALAIKVALAGQNNAVMVFDEVDQGVGGAVADAVGKRLARLSENGQVFVVTHSAQVAACAGHQFRIEKSSDGIVTKTHVHVIDEAAREEEIARMLAGETVTDAARAAARQLMQAP